MQTMLEQIKNFFKKFTPPRPRSVSSSVTSLFHNNAKVTAITTTSAIFFLGSHNQTTWENNSRPNIFTHTHTHTKLPPVIVLSIHLTNIIYTNPSLENCNAILLFTLEDDYIQPMSSECESHKNWYVCISFNEQIIWNEVS